MFFFHIGLKLGMPAVGRHFWCDFVLLKMFNYFHFFHLFSSIWLFFRDFCLIQFGFSHFVID